MDLITCNIKSAAKCSLLLFIIFIFLMDECFAGENIQFFPIGIFAAFIEDIPLAKECGFEIVHNYRFEQYPGKVDELGGYLDNAYQHDLKVMVGFERGEHFTKDSVRRRVEKFKGHPALFAWYLRDEPDKDAKPFVEEINTLIKSIDRLHPTIIASDAPEFLNIADINFAYKYPVKTKPFPDEDLGPELKRLQLSMSTGKPFYSLVQAFNWNWYRPENKKDASLRHPNMAELRFIAYAGIVNGCSGVFFFSFQTLPANPDYLHNTVKPVIAEIKSMREYLQWESVNCEELIDSSKNLLHSCRKKDGTTFLLLANASPQPIAFPPRLKQTATELERQKYPDILEPWGVYRLILNESRN